MRRRRPLLLIGLGLASVTFIVLGALALLRLPEWIESQTDSRPTIPSRQAYAEAEVLGPGVTSALAAASARVSVVLLDDPNQDSGDVKEGEERVWLPLVERTQRKELSSGDTARILTLMRREQSYVFEPPQADGTRTLFSNLCIPVYRARVIVESVGKRLEANFCFGCDDLMFAVNSDPPRHALMHSREFARFFREKFPEDAMAKKW